MELKLNSVNLQYKKGSDLAKFMLLKWRRSSLGAPALSMSPALFTLQPSGHLYQSIVESGLATAVQSSTWLDRDFNLVFMGCCTCQTISSTSTNSIKSRCRAD